MTKEIHIWPPISASKLIEAYKKLKYTGSLKLVRAVDYRKLENSLRHYKLQSHLINEDSTKQEIWKGISNDVEAVEKILQALENFTEPQKERILKSILKIKNTEPTSGY